MYSYQDKEETNFEANTEVLHRLLNKYVVTKSLKDFGPIKDSSLKNTKIMQVPAALLCYWMGELELLQTNFLA